MKVLNTKPYLLLKNNIGFRFRDASWFSQLYIWNFQIKDELHTELVKDEV